MSTQLTVIQTEFPEEEGPEDVTPDGAGAELPAGGWYASRCAELAAKQARLDGLRAAVEQAKGDCSAARNALDTHEASRVTDERAWMREQDRLCNHLTLAENELARLEGDYQYLEQQCRRLREVVEAPQRLSEAKEQVVVLRTRLEKVRQMLQRADGRLDQLRSRLAELESGEAKDLRQMAAALLESDDALLHASPADSDIARVKATIAEIESIANGLRAEEQSVFDDLANSYSRVRSGYATVAEIDMHEALPMDVLARVAAARDLCGTAERGRAGVITLEIPPELLARAKAALADEIP